MEEEKSRSIPRSSKKKRKGRTGRNRRAQTKVLQGEKRVTMVTWKSSRFAARRDDDHCPEKEEIKGKVIFDRVVERRLWRIKNLFKLDQNC